MKLIIQQILGIAFLSLAHSVATAAQAVELALEGGKVYSSPIASPIDDAVVLIRNGQITALGRRSEVKISKSARVIDCTGKFIVAGFWNSHVHFENGWQDAATAPADKLEAHMQEMLTRWGFTTVWDLGSEPVIL